jgi:adenosine deaminase
LSVAEQRKVAEAVWNALSEVERQRALSQISTLLDDKPWDWHWPMLLKGRMPTDRAAASAALLLHADPELLEQALYGQTEPRVGLKSQHRQGFAAYERPGELTGSAQLCHPAALLPYAQALVEQAEREGLAYVELRGSPHKYRSDSPAQFVADLEAALRLAGGETHAETIEATHLLNPAKPRFGFIWILDRRQRDTMAVTIQQAVAAHQQLPEFLLGLDLAGDEGTHNPQQLAAAFIPAFEACMPITIHAGEGESADNIWQAAYHLHADRIGHGLTLTTHPQLAQRFRDRGIALELCPTSNREVVGFNDPAHAESSGFPTYPLRHMLDMGLPLSLCTDNPGISRTDIANEYLCAARMIDGLNLWETLALIRQGFMHSFLPAKARDQQLARLESIVFKRVSDFFVFL